MELRHLRYFVTVAEELNFSKAALKLYTAQPSLSQQIKDLEEYVGVQLFNRTKRKVELTEEGVAFLEQARLTLMQADKAVATARQIAKTKQQRLRIGFVATAEVHIFPQVLPNNAAYTTILFDSAIAKPCSYFFIHCCYSGTRFIYKDFSCCHLLLKGLYNDPLP